MARRHTLTSVSCIPVSGSWSSTETGKRARETGEPRMRPIRLARLASVVVVRGARWSTRSRTRQAPAHQCPQAEPYRFRCVELASESQRASALRRAWRRRGYSLLVVRQSSGVERPAPAAGQPAIQPARRPVASRGHSLRARPRGSLSKRSLRSFWLKS